MGVAQRAIDGWPDHWYNRDGHIFCPARDCNKVFNSRSIRFRTFHWNDRNPPSDRQYDHRILLALSRQKRCAYCDYIPILGLKDLLDHEESEHGSSNMSTIQGYLHLMRQGLDTEEARDCREAALERLLRNVWDSEYRNRLLYRVYPCMLPHEADMRRDLLQVVAFQNIETKQDPATVILAQDFLKHLCPVPENQSPWPRTYDALRLKYAKGSI